jgi:hypothetical protein
MKKNLLIIVLLLCLITVSNARETSVTVSAEGTGKTKASAVEQARRNALKVGLEELYENDVDVSGSRILTPKVHITSDDITEEEYDQEKKYWFIEIEAIVSLDNSGKDDPGTDIGGEVANQPAILVIPTKRFCNPVIDGIQNIALNTINDYLMERGYRVVYKNDIIDMVRGNSIEPDGNWCRNLAIEVNATYYISADLVFIESPKNKDGVFFVNSSMALDVYDVENSLGIAAANHQSGQFGSRYSLYDAAVPAVKEAAKTTVEDISEKLSEALTKPLVYEIRIKGIRDYLLAREFKTSLKEHPHFVGDIKMNKKDDFYLFVVTYSNSRADEIIDDIFDAVVEKPGFRTLNPTGIIGKNINFELR